MTLNNFSVKNIQLLYETAEHVESAHARVKNISKDKILKMCRVQEFSPIRFMNEVKMAKLAYKLKIGPRIFEYGFEQGIGYICMQRMHISLKKLLDTDSLTFEHIYSLKKIIKIMKKGDFIHMDLHSDNIWFTKKKQAKFIDYDKVDKICRTKVDCQNFALNYSTFEIQDIIPILYESSKRKKELLKLQNLII